MDKNYLIPSSGNPDQILQYCDDLFASEHVATACAHTIILQPTLSPNPLFPTLHENLALAALHATDYNNINDSNLANAFFGTIASISGYVVRKLRSAQETISIDSNSIDIDDFNAYIQAIKKATTSVNPDEKRSFLVSLNEVCQKYSDLLHSIADDNTKFQTTLTVASSSHDIENLEIQFAKIQNQLADLNLEVTKGATAHFASLGKSVAAFGVKITKQFVNGNIQKGLVAGAILEIVQNGNPIAKLNEEQHKQQLAYCEQIRDISTKIAINKKDKVILTLSASQVKEFHNRAEKSVSLLSAFITLMTDWEDSLDLLTNGRSTWDAQFYSSQVKSGIDFWTKVYENATLCLERIELTQT